MSRKRLRYDTRLRLWAVVIGINNEASRLLTGKTFNVRSVSNRGDVWDSCGLSLAVYLSKREAMDDARDARKQLPGVKVEVVRFREATDAD